MQLLLLLVRRSGRRWAENRQGPSKEVWRSRAGSMRRRRRWPKERDPVARRVELLGKRPESRWIHAQDDAAPAVSVDTDVVGDVGVAECDDESQARAVIPRDALGINLHHIPYAGEDLANFRIGPVLLGEVPHDDVREPSQLAYEAIVGVLHPLQLGDAHAVVHRLHRHGRLPLRLGVELHEGDPTGRGAEPKGESGRNTEERGADARSRDRRRSRRLDLHEGEASGAVPVALVNSDLQIAGH